MSEKLLDALRVIKAMPKQHDTPAICGLVKRILGDTTDRAIAQNHLELLFMRWPGRAGMSYTCPVEGNYHDYDCAVRRGNLWNNPRRVALLDYLINELEKENANIQR